MQFDMKEDGSVVPLPAPCVDTGMGLERLAAILQHVHSNYEIDIFDQLIKAAARETGVTDLDNKSLRVIADHIRATAFLVSDGVIPSNEGRGYVQRRIVRRAIRHGYKLGKKTPFFHKLVADLVRLMGDAYPAIREQEQRITDVLKTEEERFFETLANGMEILDAALDGGAKVLPGEVAFKLHDTYGFPLDLTNDVCRERDVAVDEAGFKPPWKSRRPRPAPQASSRWTRRWTTPARQPVHRLRASCRDCKNRSALRRRDKRCSPESRSKRRGGAGHDPVLRRKRRPGGRRGRHHQRLGPFCGGRHAQDQGRRVWPPRHARRGTLNVGDTVQAQVNTAVRAATMRNHSVTHIMHKALREVLGSHVQQKGSLVNADRTRFDFAHNAPVTDAEIREIERRVNEEILANAATEARVMDIESAQKTGAMMLFGEKYGETVRVLDIGTSRELCGGTHVQRTGDIGLFKVVAEGGVAAGVRRIEAVTGANALAYLQSLEDTVNQAAGALKAPVAELNARIAQALEQRPHAGKGSRRSRASWPPAQGDELLTQAVDVKGLKVLAAHCCPAPTPRPCATPWTSSRTSSRPPPSCWPPWMATRCRWPLA
jgi:alanyl-tRNA synthetase